MWSIAVKNHTRKKILFELTLNCDTNVQVLLKKFDLKDPTSKHDRIRHVELNFES